MMGVRIFRFRLDNGIACFLFSGCTAHDAIEEKLFFGRVQFLWEAGCVLYYVQCTKRSRSYASREAHLPEIGVTFWSIKR